MRSRLCRLLLPNLLVLGATLPVLGHDPITTNLTWSKEISRIVYKHCAACHSDGGQAMPLVTWEQARPWAKAIRDEVASRRMPPWGAVQGIGQFKADRSLSMPEIEMLMTWVEGGAPEGDPVYLPGRIENPPPALPQPGYHRRLTIRTAATLVAPGALVAIKPAGAADAWATEPDGTVTRLIWVQQPSPFFHGPYIYETPQHFPAGTRLHTTGKTVLYLK